MKKQSGFTLIELLLVLAIIGIISAIAIPALLSQRSRARDKSSITNMTGRMGDLVGQYDKLREAGALPASMFTALGSYLTATAGADKNPWDATVPAFKLTVANGAAGTTQSAAITAAKLLATVKGQPAFGISLPGAGTPGFVYGGVLVDNKVNGSTIVTKASAIE